jgi:eukaryotic-like serine/threonine-protein kinase
MVGEFVMGRFRVLQRIGSGGMGTVYSAFDERLQRQVAVKEISGVDGTRVLREAQAVARLNHPGIVTLYELGAQGDRALLVSELVDGETLFDLARRGELTDREVAQFGADVCAALGHAHERGVVHRDLKPQNVIVKVDDGAGARAKLMDFGVASVSGAPRLTATGEVVGTLAYMAPEQAEGGPVGEAADVYSLALTLYECWAGRNPVARRTPAQTALEIGRPLLSLGDYRPDLPRHLTDCIDACLEPAAELRPPVGDLEACLREVAPSLDGSLAVPAASPEAEDASDSLAGLRAVQLAALCVWGVTVAVIAAGAGRPGLALLLAALSAPAILVASWLPWATSPALAPLLGAVSAAPVYPALAGSRGTALERAVLGALGWFWLLAGAAAAGLGSRLGIIHSPPSGWTRSTGVTTNAILVHLLSPEALLGAAAFGLAALLLGIVLRAAHLGVALLGALLWAGGLEGALQVVAGGRLAGHPALIAAAALAAVIVEFRLLRPRPAGVRAPLPKPGRIGRRGWPGMMGSSTPNT